MCVIKLCVCVCVTKLCVTKLCVRQLYVAKLCNKVVCVTKFYVTKFYVTKLCVTKLCIWQSCVCDNLYVTKLYVRRLCVKRLCVWKLCVWQSCVCDKVVCVWQFVCDKVVCEKVVCEKVMCVKIVCVTKLCMWQSCVCVWQFVCDKVVCEKVVCEKVMCVKIVCVWQSGCAWEGCVWMYVRTRSGGDGGCGAGGADLKTRTPHNFVGKNTSVIWFFLVVELEITRFIFRRSYIIISWSIMDHLWPPSCEIPRGLAAAAEPLFRLILRMRQPRRPSPRARCVAVAVARGPRRQQRGRRGAAHRGQLRLQSFQLFVRGAHILRWGSNGWNDLRTGDANRCFCLKDLKASETSTTCCFVWIYSEKPSNHTIPDYTTRIYRNLIYRNI